MDLIKNINDTVLADQQAVITAAEEEQAKLSAEQEPEIDPKSISSYMADIAKAAEE